MVTCQRNAGTNLKGLPKTGAWNNLSHTFNNIILDYNPKHKINRHNFILI